MNKIIDMVIIQMLMAFGAIIKNDALTVEQLQDKMRDIHDEINVVNNLAASENRDLNDDEAKRVDGLFTEFEDIENNIKRIERMEAQASTLNTLHGRQSAPNAPAPQAGASDPADPSAPAPRQHRLPQEPRDPQATARHGFRHFGEYCTAVLHGSKNVNAIVDPRLVPMNAPGTFSTEGVGSEGGFAIPPEWRTEIKDLTLNEDSLVGLTDEMTSGSNTMVLPRDENQAHDTTNGVQAYWEGEAKQMTESKVDLDSMIIRLNKLTALVPVTEELMADASGMDSYLRKKIPEKMGFKLNDGVFRGNGVGRPLGILNAKNLIEVAKESAQTADTVVADNVIKMWSRMPAKNRRNAVWLINQDIEPQLMTMKHPGDDSPLFIPAGGLSSTPFDTLLGRPIRYIESASTLGDKGDINFVDMSQYMTIMKTGGMRTDISMHLYFDYDMSVFRFIMRMAGQSWANKVIDPANGTTTRSPFVTLAARA